MEKKCVRCEETKDAEQHFYKYGSKDGFMSRCKKCVEAVRIEKKEKKANKIVHFNWSGY